MLFGGGNTGRLRNHPNDQNTLQEIISNHPRFKAKDSGWREAVSVEVVDRFEELLPNEKELGLNTARDWVDIVYGRNKNDPLWSVVDWENTDLLQKLNVTSDNQPKIRRSIAWFDRFIVGQVEYFQDDFRYVKSANYVLSNMDINNCLDLWVIAQEIRSRTAIDSSMEDIDQWMDYAPYKNNNELEVYLDAIKREKISPLVGGFPVKNKDMLKVLEETMPESTIHSLIRPIIAKALWDIGDVIHYDKRYLLPSQRIAEMLNEEIDFEITDESDLVISLGSPEFFRLDLRDYDRVISLF